jgi:superfamily II DNA helicase RecQ
VSGPNHYFPNEDCVTRDAIDYHQAVGRAARDGGAGQAIVDFDPTRVKRSIEDEVYGTSVIYDTLQDNTTCRRLRLAIFLD